MNSMREEAFNFITCTVNILSEGSEITRVQLIRHMLQLYKPGPKDSSQATCRCAGDVVFRYLVSKGILEKLGRGRYKVLKHIQRDITYEVFLQDQKNSRYYARERKNS